MRKLFLFVFITFLLLSTITFPKAAFADQYFFEDEFNEERPINSLDPSKWDVYPNNNFGIVTVQESGGELDLSQQSLTTQFPLIISKNAFPDGDFSFEISFIFYQVGNWSTGFGLTTTPPINGVNLSDPLFIYYTQGYLAQGYTTLRIGGNLIWNTGPLPEQRVLRIDRIGKKYLFYIDNALVGTSEDTDLQAKYFWMGEPSITNPAQLWSDFKVDYIRVKDLSVPAKTPLILIPGIGGSEFKTADDINWSQPNGHGGIFTHIYPKDEQVWVNQGEAIKPGNDDYFDILKLKSDGQTPEANLILTGTLFGPYQDAINFFVSNGYELNKTLFTFPYDWRKDLSLTAPLLDQKIADIKNQTGSQKVDIVSHSMGGLVARNYISDSNRAGNVRKLVELGTPHLGSVNSIKSLVYGDCLTDSKLQALPVCLGLSRSEVRDVIQNMLGGFELSPTQMYSSFYDGSDSQHPLVFKDDRDIDSNGITGALNYAQIKILLTNLGYNTALLTSSENFHNLDNNLSDTNGVDTTIIAGSGILTLGQIIERNKFDFAGIKIPEKDGLMINGDATVPLFSASLNDSAKNYSLLGSAKAYYTKQKHDELIKDGVAMELAKNILSGNNQSPNGISNIPYTVKGKLISLHSPVNISVTDSFNNQTGIDSNGDLLEDIHGSTIETLDDAKFIWLPEDGQYNITLQGTGSGSFDLKIRDFDNDINIETILYKDIPVTPSLKGKLLLDTGSSNPPTLQIDQNGDGAFEKNVNPTGVVNGSEYQDTTPPEIQASFNINTKKTEIIGTDNSPIQEFNPQNGVKIFKDLADNSTRVQFNQTNKNFLDSLNLQSIQYNNSTSTLPSNQFLVLYTINPKTNKAIVLNQDVLIKGVKIISTIYNPLTNKTTILRKDKGGKIISEVKTGMLLIRLMSSNGSLNVSY